METLIIIGLAAVLAAVFVLFFTIRRKEPDNSSILLQKQVESLREQINSSMTDLRNQLKSDIQHQSSSIGETRKAMDDRLDSAARVISEVQKSLGKVGEALVPVAELRDIMKAPKLRGGFGEILLEKLLEEMMPSKLYVPQYSFKDGERVDAVVTIGGRLVPIDSKFPLDQYQEYCKATNDETKKTSRRAFVSALKKHIDDVAIYIRPDEGTYQFALMYIPSENIYYELFVSSSADESLWPHATKRRVFPVSPNTLYVYLQTIAFGLKGMKIAEQAQEIFGKLEQLNKTFGDVKRVYEKVGTHLKNAQGAYDDAGKRLDKFETKLTAIGESNVPAIEPAPKEDEVPLIQ